MLFGMAEHLELPRPWRLILTAGWNLAESLGLPVAGYFVGVRLGGRDAGMLTATGVVWLTVIGRKVVTRSVPGLLTISALVLTLQPAVVIVTGSVLFFLLQFPLANLGLCELEQEDQHAAGDDHHGRLQGEHQGRDGEQAGDAARDDLAADRGEPDHAGRGQHARVPAAEPDAHEVPGDRKAEGFGQVPSSGQDQPPGARQLEVLSHGEEHTVAGCTRAGIAGRWRKEESDRSAPLYNGGPVT